MSANDTKAKEYQKEGTREFEEAIAGKGPDMPPDAPKSPAEQDLEKAAGLWVEWQRGVVDVAHHFILFQPTYQIAVRNTVGAFPLTAAGWQLEMGKVRPA